MTIDMSLLLAAGSALLAIGVSWGVVRSAVSGLKEEQKEIKADVKVLLADALRKTELEVIRADMREMQNGAVRKPEMDALRGDIREIQRDVKSILGSIGHRREDPDPI